MSNGLSSTQHGIAGAASGAITRFVCQPLDVVKIRLQIQTGLVKGTMKYPTVLKTFTTIAKEEGVQALWKGHIPAQWLSMIFGAVQFSTYKKLTESYHKETLVHFGAGAISGVLATAASFPFDVIRTIFVAQGEPKVRNTDKLYKGTLSTGISILKSDGIGGLYRGLVPTFFHIAPNSGLIFGYHFIFSNLIFKILKTDNASLELPFISLVSGGAAGFASKITVYPFDLAKKRLQVQGMPDSALASGSVRRTTGLVDCVIRTVKCEGVLGLYKGLSPSLIKAVVTNALYLASYDLCCQMLF